jgi:hypothetical protein
MSRLSCATSEAILIFLTLESDAMSRLSCATSEAILIFLALERYAMSHLPCATSDAILDLSSSIFHYGNLGNLRVKTMTIRTFLNRIEKASVQPI